MGMVEVESTFSWEWFLTTVKNDLNIVNTSPFTIMSDKQKGLINAVAKVFPDSEHRFCVRHLYQNFHMLFKGETLKNDLWAIARSTNDTKFKMNREKLREDSPSAYAWLDGKDPTQWVKAFFSVFPKCDILLNNMSEVYNSYILEARDFPVISMMECIKSKITARHEGKQRRWQLSGIPCSHSIACFREERIDPEDMVHKCYTIETYLQAYGHNVMPMRDRAHWEQVDGPFIHPPVYKKRMGRPPKNRKKTPEEKLQKDGSIALNKKGVSMHCSICGKADHNKKGHQKFMQREMEREAQEQEDEIEDPSILNDIRPHVLDSRMDPMHLPLSMVYRMREEERVHVSNVRPLGPLPEIARFVADARDSIPERRSTTTATTRGRIRGKGKARALDEGETSASRGGKTKRVRRGSSIATAGPSNAARGGTRGPSNAATRGGRGVARGPNNATRGGERVAATWPTYAARGGRGGAATGGRGGVASSTSAGNGWWHLLLGQDGNTTNSAIPDLNTNVIPELNTQEVINVTQNAPIGHVE
uniref:Zinc finger PMZ-type domain-containing protein n=1 Tax=Aegilops tauschii subsp. strangulata TaxID=200361 RepID=A0A453FLQ3_AEGTS